MASRPITTGKLLRPGGPGGGASKLASRPAQTRPVQARPLPSASNVMNKPVSALNGAAHTRNDSSTSMRAPPPPPPPPAQTPASQDPTCRALWDFAGQTSGELSVKKGDIVVLVRKEPNGKSKIRSSTLK